MTVEVGVPVQGNDDGDCVLAEVYVAVGDAVTAGQRLFSIETAKAVYEVESTAAGTVVSVLHGPGEELPVHTPVVLVEPVGAGGAADPGRTARTVPDGVATGAGTAVAHPGLEAQDGAGAGAGAPSRRLPRGPVPASPRARVIAARRGIDLGAVAGTGPRGRVLVQDVLDAAGRWPSGAGSAPAPESAGDQRQPPPRAAATAPSLPAVPPAPPTVTTPSPVPTVSVPDVPPADPPAPVPLTGIRRVVADRMTASLRDSAQFTLMAVADARPLQRLRAVLRAGGTRARLDRVTVTDLVALACVRTLADHPALNAHLTPAGLTRWPAVHLGLAVATERGLLVTVLRDADRHRLAGLTAARADAVAAARAGRSAAADLTGSTFTVSSLGAGPVTFFTPVLNPPEVAILGVGGIVPAVVPVPGEPPGDAGEIAPAVHLSLTVDHRAVDGAPAAAFLADLCLALAAPETTLAR
ncbi:dihydrolipoamide acetyltransferase family protein [Nakamurella endophytica]|uniref:Dihydrolipoamide acetyltransferase component of pyruvate dehydrogenase complex n=1 Tax=Nakamurella endophytica TaxID=1748367 RepID=A0A917WMB6_9ACTN|nr:dihydrolipoamide acetyltransferase family protein [Nakamurella endophytica]GGM14853.1 dihydrolipoyllysine-residue acetyltransferase component of acetoin cleaving system [Nakamurella endophytica]